SPANIKVNMFMPSNCVYVSKQNEKKEFEDSNI
ncbi:MAG: hypothetical protein ACI8RD_013228, partial [Bacillariaceae sp.]